MKRNKRLGVAALFVAFIAALSIAAASLGWTGAIGAELAQAPASSPARVSTQPADTVRAPVVVPEA